MYDRKGVLLLLFDLPSVTSEDHKEYYHFRKKLLQNGFLQLQESCYLKLIRNISSADAVIKSLDGIMPKAGNVSVLSLSMTEFRGIRCLLGEPFQIDVFTDDVLILGESEEESA